jgi:hypothetical protein
MYYPLEMVLIVGFYCQQGNHCKMGMVFAINPATAGDKTFQAYKNLAMGGTATVIQTVNTATTVSVTAPPPPPPPPPAAAVVPGYNIATDGQCQCVCNIDIGNGYPLYHNKLMKVLQIQQFKD